jgi:hypothetical protein
MLPPVPRAGLGATRSCPEPKGEEATAIVVFDFAGYVRSVRAPSSPRRAAGST